MPSRKNRGAGEGVKRITPFVKDVVGLKGLKIVESIGDGATDEQIEDKTKFKMAEIRSLLNQLHEHGIVEYNREKNLQTGWFTYTWKVNTDRAFKNFITLKKREHADLTSRIANEENTVFYNCSRDCKKLPFDVALDAQFRCPKCDRKMKAVDNARLLEEYKNRLHTTETILLKLGETPPQHLT